MFIPKSKLNGRSSIIANSDSLQNANYLKKFIVTEMYLTV